MVDCQANNLAHFVPLEACLLAPFDVYLYLEKAKSKPLFFFFLNGKKINLDNHRKAEDGTFQSGESSFS